MCHARLSAQPQSRRWHRWADLAWTVIGLGLTAMFSIALYFDLSGISPFR